jgi:hypothetical protein
VEPAQDTRQRARKVLANDKGRFLITGGAISSGRPKDATNLALCKHLSVG